MQIFTNPMLHARFLLVQRQVWEAKLHQPLQTGFYGDCNCYCWKQTNLLYLIWDGFFFDIMRQTALQRITESFRTVALEDNLGCHGLRSSLVWAAAQLCGQTKLLMASSQGGWKPRHHLPSSAAWLFSQEKCFPSTSWDYTHSEHTSWKLFGIAYSETRCYVVLCSILQSISHAWLAQDILRGRIRLSSVFIKNSANFQTPS